MNFDSELHKNSDTHEIMIEMNMEGRIDGAALAGQLTALGMVIKPNQRRIIQDNNFRITLRAKSGYTQEEFFKEQQPFLDKMCAGRVEN